MSEILAEIIRNGKVESIHRGHIAVVDADGNLVASVGEPTHQTYIRSAAKPFQIMPLLESGAVRHYGLTDKELAVIMASHNGEQVHVETVTSLQKKVGLKETRLQCGIHPPMHQPTAKSLLQKSTPLTTLHNNCSGKHSGMLALASFRNWPLDSYLEHEHPVQIKIKEKISLVSGVPKDEIHVGVDGCGAPVFYLPVQSMALMYAKLAEGTLPFTTQIFEMMTSYPQMIAGTGRFDTDLIEVMAGRMVSKVGAEGVRCLGVRAEKPIGIALKIEDGHKRASDAVMLEILSQLNLISDAELEALAKYRRPVIKNHSGVETGFIQPSFTLNT